MSTFSPDPTSLGKCLENTVLNTSLAIFASLSISLSRARALCVCVLAIPLKRLGEEAEQKQKWCCYATSRANCYLFFLFF